MSSQIIYPFQSFYSFIHSIQSFLSIIHQTSIKSLCLDQGIDKKEERMFFQALGGRGDIPPKIEDDDEDETAMSPTQVKVFR